MTILNTEMITETNFWFNFWICIFFGLAFLCVVFAISAISNYYSIFFSIVSCLCLVLLIPAGIFIGITPQEKITNEYKYEVLLDENYSATELINNYEILETRGDIYIIKEKVEQ